VKGIFAELIIIIIIIYLLK